MKLKLKLIAMIIVIMVLLSGCNRTIIDTKWTFNKAIIDFGGEIIEVKIDKWKDYEGDAVQIIDKDGKVYLTSYVNVILINE